MQSYSKEVSASAAQEWQNERTLDAFQNYDSISKQNKKVKSSRIGSRDGSRRGGKKYKNMLSSVQSKRQRSNHSKQGVRRVIHTSREIVAFNEYQNEANVNKEIGMNDEKINRSKSEISDDGRNKLEFDDSHLNEAISYQYSLGDRSSFVDENEVSIFEGKDHNLGEENFVEIVEQDSFEKLESYRDRWPCLSIRKLVLRIKLLITRSAYLIISHPAFEYISLVVIVANSVVLTLEDPTDPDSGSTGFLATLDQVFLALYTLEMMLKILGLGFVWNKGSYLRDSWNILDFVVV
jgi:hypothetical protein